MGELGVCQLEVEDVLGRGAVRAVIVVEVDVVVVFDW